MFKKITMDVVKHMEKQGRIMNKISSKKKNQIQCLLITIPFLIFIFAFTYVPLFGWLLSFTDFKPGLKLTDAEFIGLKNYIKLFSDRRMFSTLRNTLVLSLLKIICSVFPVMFAIMMNDVRNNKVKKFVQTVTTLPNFISWIIVFGLAFSMFSSNGAVNQLLEILGLPISQFGLIGDVDHAWTFQTGLYLWKTLGWETIIYLAAITGIDMELYDAAKVDGANKFNLIRYITLPGVAPTYLVLLLLSISNLLSSGFDQYYVFWNPMTCGKLEVLDYYIYKMGFQMNQYSYSITLGVVKSLFSIALLFTVNWISKKVRGNSLV